MSLEENKAIIHGLYEAYNKHNVGLLDKFLAQDYVHHAQKLRGLESVKQYEAMIYKGFPDLHDTIEGIIACMHATHISGLRKNLLYSFGLS